MNESEFDKTVKLSASELKESVKVLLEAMLSLAEGGATYSLRQTSLVEEIQGLIRDHDMDLEENIQKLHLLYRQLRQELNQ